MEFLDTVVEPTEVRDPLVGTKVLGYEIRRPIGVGGMGKVYEAIDRNLGRRAAVKVLLPEVAKHSEFVARLQAEARAANAVRHRGIVDVFGFTELPDGRHAIVMEYLEGVPLDEELHRLAAEGRRLPTGALLELLEQLAAVLSAAHGAGVVHRDLKPSNLFLMKEAEGGNTLKVLDFGVAKYDVQNSPKTATNTLLGTPHYMAPEQAAGQPAAPSMDLYAFGVIAFELFTGRTPFLHANVMSQLLAHQQEAPPTPSSINPSLPAALDAFLLKLLAKRPDERFASAQEIRAALAPLRRALSDAEALPTAPELQALGGPAASAPPAARNTTQAVARQAIRRSPWPAVAIALGLAVLLAGGLWAARDRTSTSEAPRPSPPQPTATALAEPPPQPTRPPEATRLPEPKPPPEPARPPEPSRSPEPEPPAPVQRAPVAPKSAAPVAPTPTSTLGTRRAALARRIRSLDERLMRAEGSGASVSLERQQVRALTAVLQSGTDSRQLDQVEVALQRLEADVP